MGKARHLLGRLKHTLSSNVPRVVLIGLVCLAVAVAYHFMRDLKVDADSLAAIAGLLAALGAMEAARESRRTARDSSRALAIALKPQPGVSTKVVTSETAPLQGSFTVLIENIGVHAVKGGLLEWFLRDGTTGSMSIGPIQGRVLPSVGMFHKVEQSIAIMVAHAFDDLIAGVDRVTFTYYGEHRAVEWRQTVEAEHEVQPGMGRMRALIAIPSTRCVRSDRTETEV